MMLLLSLMGSAEAAVNWQYLCVSIDQEFEDLWPNADYWTTNAVRPLRGVRVEVKSGTQVVFDGYADEQGNNIGCVTLSMDSNETYRITAYAEASVRGYTIRSEDWSSTLGYASPIDEVLSYNFVPPAQKSTTDFVIPGDLKGWPQVTVAQFMAARAGTGGFGSWPGNEIYFLSDAPRVGTGHYATVMDDCLSSEHELGDPGCTVIPAHISAYTPFVDASANKFVIAHEVGHWIGGMNDEQTNPAVDYKAKLFGCDGAGTAPESHNFFQRDFQSAAAVEGFASYIAAATFNRTDEYDCTIQRGWGAAYDYDLDLASFSRDGVPTYGEFSCEGRPWDVNHNGVADVHLEPTWVASYVTARDWLADVAGEQSCTTSIVGMGNEYDWLRYYWDMRTDEHLSALEVVQLYDLASPRSWEDFASYAPDRPAARAAWAASAMGRTAEHNAQKSNGQGR